MKRISRSWTKGSPVWGTEKAVRMGRCAARSYVVVTLTLLIGSASATARGQGDASPVVVATVVERSIGAGQSFVGTVMPLKRSTVGSAVDGRLLEYPVNEGDRVNQGQTLAQLRTDALEIQLAGARAELELRKEELAELQNGTRPEEIEQARARMQAAKAVMEFRTAKYERTLMLSERGSGAVTEEQVQEDRSIALEKEQAYLEAQAAYDLAVKGPRREKIAQAEARVANQTEEVNRIQDQINKHTIVAPFDGYVAAEHTEVGEWVERGGLVAEIVALDQVDVETPVPERFIAYARIGTSARVEIPAVPQEAWIGKVALIVPQADLRARTFPVKIRVRNQIDGGTPLLKSGMLARITLPTGPTKRSLLVPKDALVLGGPQPTVYVVDYHREAKSQGNGGSQAGRPGEPQTGTVRPLPVTLGVADGRLIEVDAELKAGQQVVVLGNERLRPDQEVRVTRVVEPDELLSDVRDTK